MAVPKNEPIVSMILPRGAHRAVYVLLATMLTGTPAAAAQDAPAGRFAERIERLELEVDVLVTDGDGRAVGTLGGGQLEVRHDGTQVTVAAVAPPDGRPQRVAFYIDHRRLLPHRRAATLALVRKLADRRLDRGDSVLVASFADRLRFHSGFSGDPATIGSAFDAAGEVPRRTGALEVERQRLARRQSGSALEVEVVDFVARYRDDLRASLDALREVTAVVAGAGAPAALVVAADALPRDPAFDVGAPTATSKVFVLPPAPTGITSLDTVSPRIEYLASMPSLPTERDVTSVPLDLIATANAARITLFPLAGDARADLLPDPRTRALLRHAERTVLLDALASWTGGAVLPSNRASEAAVRLDRELDLRHRVAFPAPATDDRQVALEVRASARDLTARARRTLAFRAPVRALAEQTLAALRLGLARNRHDARLGQPGARATPDGLVELELPVTVARAPADGTVTLCVVVGRPTGDRSPPVAVEVPAPGPRFAHRLRIRIRPGAQHLVLGIASPSDHEASLLHLGLGAIAGTGPGGAAADDR